MDRLKERLELTKKALAAFDEVLREPYSKIIRDAAIQRFEFTLEAIWKLGQRYLFLQEGLELGSPKAVLRGCFQVGLLNEQQTQILLAAVNDRNLTVHTYNENLAEQIYQHAFLYQPVLNMLFESIIKQL